jgi:hypothetical protein
MKPVLPELSIYKGQEHIIHQPSGRVVTIRETNGNDDETLSKLGDVNSGDNQFNFIADITLDDSSINGKPTIEDIMNWPTNDRYYLLFKQRIINHGVEVKFNHECPNPDCKDPMTGDRSASDYIQDLSEFDSDLKNYKAPKKADPKQKIAPYPSKEAIVEMSTSSHKKLRYKILTGVLEKRALDMPQSDHSQNTRLLLRELETFIEGQWIRLTTFHAIPSKEMGEIRGNIERLDPIFDPAVKCTCPKCKLRFDVGLFTIPSFYFPAPKM